MKILIAIFLIVFALTSKINDQVLNDLSLNNGKSDIMINFEEQVKFDQDKLDVMNWEARGHFVLNKLLESSKVVQKEVKQYLEENNIRYESFYIQNIIAAYNVPEKIVNELSLRKDIKTIFSNKKIQQELPKPLTIPTTEKSFQPEWNLDWVNATALWRLGFTGNGSVVGGSDTGIQWDHPALKENYRGVNGQNVNHNYNWFDGVTNERFPQCRTRCGCSLKVPCDDQGHGTHTISTAVGGRHRQVGVAPGAKWIGCRGFSDMGRHWQSATFITCLQFFLAPTDLEGKNPNPSLRPDASVHSYGCQPQLGCPNHNDMEPSMNALRAAGHLASVAAQNAGPSCGSVNRQPAHYESVTTVGATGIRTNNLASFSSKGPVVIDGSNRRKPDFVAPGSSILAAMVGGSYTQMSGTSMACPHVAGAFALFWSAVPSLRGNIKKSVEIFEKSAHQIRSRDCQSQQDVPNNLFGYGMINIYQAYLDAKQAGY